VTTPAEVLPFAYQALMIGLAALLLGPGLIYDPYVGPTEPGLGWHVVALGAILLLSAAVTPGRDAWQSRDW
jgi:hypothetical protein